MLHSEYTPMNHLLKLPIGIQDFRKLREGGFVYVDKTKYIYQLLQEGTVYFLSRPRRFGKSLLISTLEAIFKGQSELFKETWIDTSDYAWMEYPVIRLDMSQMSKNNINDFKMALLQNVMTIAQQYHIDLLHPVVDAATALNSLINELGKKQKVVVLIDEYDKPILDNLADMELATAMRDVLRQFYTILKAQDGNLRFVLLTGVTKFSRVSIFSGLNNLQDLTMTDKYAAICGYTQTELVHVFDPWIQLLSKKQNTLVEAQYEKIKLWYNGYQFSPEGERVYNPFSTLLLFEQQIYKPHWFVTGTPTFLIDLIEAAHFNPEEMESLEVSDADFENHDVASMGLVALLYQTGYLTIKHYDAELRLYKLGYPNFEVQESFVKTLFERLSRAPSQDQMRFLSDMAHSIRAGDYDKMFSALKTFYAVIPYELYQDNEKHYQTIFYLIFHLVGCRVNAEVSTNRGRMDAILELKDRILIFEFKLNKSADTALQQIHDKQYYQYYQSLSKTIVLFGVNFDTTQRNITEWKSETI